MAAESASNPEFGAGTLTGKVAIVTGVASGRGASTAALLSRSGAVIVFGDPANEVGETRRPRRGLRRFTRRSRRDARLEPSALRATLARARYDLAAVDVIVSDDAIVVLTDLAIDDPARRSNRRFINPTGLWLATLWSLCA